MAFIIVEPCVGTCDTACVDVCPVEAIYEESEVPGEWNEYIKINYEWFGQEAPE